jgi:hypothetical protein
MSDTPQVLLAYHLKALKLPTFLREYDKIARQCAAEGVAYPRFLLRLAEQELIDRGRRVVERRIKAAKFPTVKSLDSFDFVALPSLNKALVMELARCEYVGRRAPLDAGAAAPLTPNDPVTLLESAFALAVFCTSASRSSSASWHRVQRCLPKKLKDIDLRCDCSVLVKTIRIVEGLCSWTADGLLPAAARHKS